MPAFRVLTIVFGVFASNIFLGLQADDVRPCSDDISMKLLKTQSIPESHTIPVGRTFLVEHYGVALIFSIGTQELPQDSAFKRGYALNGTVRLCKPTPTTANHKKITLDITNLENLTFISRLVGPEILVGSISKIGSLKYPGEFQWKVSFPPFAVQGEYKPEIHTLWINDGEDPEMEYRGVSIDERVNAGRILHLGALGIFPYFAVDHSWKRFSLDGLAVRPCSGYFYHYPIGKKVYLMRNNTLHEFPNTQTLAHLGYNEKKDVRPLLISFLKTFPIGDNLPYLTSSPTEEEYSKGLFIRKPVVDHSMHLQLSYLREIRHLRYGNDMQQHSLVFGLSSHIRVLDLGENANETLRAMAARAHQLSLPVCTKGDEAGRWVREPACDRFDQNWGPGLAATIGSECTHASTVYFYFEIKNRSTSMVWRPYRCRLAHHSICGGKDTACAAEAGMTSQDLSADGTFYSSAANCLSRKKIGFIAGFGDSLGDEQWRNVASLLGLSIAFIEGPGASGVVCRGGASYDYIAFITYAVGTSTFVLIVLFGTGGTNAVAQKNFHHMSNTKGLTDCVLKSVEKSVASRKGNGISSVVAVTNFMAAHLLSGKEDMATISSYLEAQAKAHSDLAVHIKKTYNITYQRIFFSGCAAHGFRNAGFTRSRMELLNAHATRILGAAGWDILDAYNVTFARPDGTTDGHHYRGGVSLAVTDVLMTSLCK